jgi:hypothetical protein
MSIQAFHIARLARPAVTRSLFHPARTTFNTSRLYATAPNEQPPRSSNTVFLVVTGTAAAAGAYWYLTRPQHVKEVKEKIKRNKEDLSAKARELSDAGRAQAQDVAAQSREKYAEAKVRSFHLVY